MKKLIVCVLLLIFALFPVTAYAEEWDMSVPTEITAEVRELFDQAMAELVSGMLTVIVGNNNRANHETSAHELITKA